MLNCDFLINCKNAKRKIDIQNLKKNRSFFQIEKKNLVFKKMSVLLQADIAFNVKSNLHNFCVLRYFYRV